MKNKIQICTFLLVALLVSAIPVHAQTAGISTTLSAAITDTRSQTVVVASATSITAGSTVLMVNREVMFVNAVNGTTLRVMRGYGGSRAYTHASGDTVRVGPASGVGTFIAFAKFGTCTATNEAYLPQVVANINASTHGALVDCFGSNWQINDNLPRYAFVVSPSAARSATSPAAGTASSITGQAGGAQSATTGNGAAGAALAFTGGAGGAGGSSSGTAGAGGAVSLVGGAGAGTVTGGAGGAATVKGGAGGNGTSAGGSGGDVILQAGAVGTGGTGSAGLIKLKDAADPTKIAAISLTGLTTATTRTITVPDASITLSGARTYNCGTTTTASCTSLGATPIIHSGQFALGSASPSAATITGLSPAFTSSSSYVCSLSPTGATAAIAAGGLAITYVSGSSFTVTGPNTVTTQVNYVCIGN